MVMGDCSNCDGDANEETCNTDPMCRFLQDDEKNTDHPNAGAQGICVEIGTCDSDCTECTVDECEGDQISDSRADCSVVTPMGVQMCIGMTCATNCEQCVLELEIQEECEASTAEPNGCVYSNVGSESCVAETPNPTAQTDEPTRAPSELPSNNPTMPSPNPTVSPTTRDPTCPPTNDPTSSPSNNPTMATDAPTMVCVYPCLRLQTSHYLLYLGTNRTMSRLSI